MTSGAALVLLALAAAAVLAFPRTWRGERGLVAADQPAVVIEREITGRFGMAHPVVWVIEARRGTIWRPALLATVQSLTREVLATPGVVSFDVVSLASPNVRGLDVRDGELVPTYLMATVPGDAAAVDALRRRVDDDPMLRGNLVSADGRAALVVANFREDADPGSVGRAALALRDRHRDGERAVWATGAAVLAETAPAALRAAAPRAAALAAVGLALLLGVLGWRRGAAALAAGVLAATIAAAARAAAGPLWIPWSLYGVLSGAVAAAIVATQDRSRSAPRLAVGLVLACAVAAAASGGGVREYAVTSALAVAAALVTGLLVRSALAVPAPPPPRRAFGRRHAALAVAAVLALGGARPSLQLDPSGYALRYLPGAATEDLRAFVRLFPPPTQLAVRVSGAPGFVASPPVLHAFEGLAASLDGDPAVIDVTSVADLVKVVHRAFNDGGDDLRVIPDDAGLVARYFALAYSPGFRRFVDRGLGMAVVWVRLGSSAPRDVARVRERLARQLAAAPIPDARAVAIGGDGAVLLAMAAQARALAAVAIAVAAAFALWSGLVLGWRGGLRAALAAALALFLGAGLLGWIGAALDLVTIPLLATAMVAAGFAAALRTGARSA